jgi:hypothetical protein
MDKSTYAAAAERIKAGRVVEVNGRSASSLEELDWIQAVETHQPPPEQVIRVEARAPQSTSTAVRDAQRALEEANTRRVAEAELAAAEAGMTQMMPPHPMAVTENPTTTVEGLAQVPPVNPGQPEAAAEVGAGPVVTEDTPSLPDDGEKKSRK